MEIVISVGARPGWIKSWPVYRAFVERGIHPTVVCTGQHQEIIQQQQAILPMPIDYWLVEEQPSLPLEQLYGLIYDRACDYLSNDLPDAVFVNGDTTSALAVATAAFHLQIPVAHIEAGLRSWNLSSPYPEEFNRITIDAMSTYLFAPTPRAANICGTINQNGRICVTGNTVIDSLKEGLRQIGESVPFVVNNRYILLDLHRRETDMHSMGRIVKVILEQAKLNGLKVWWPVHPSPKVQEVAKSFEDQDETLICWRPQQYLHFINFMKNSELILTDSGGTVEEAITLGIPTLQLRDYTDRQEAIDMNCSWLATTRPEEVGRLLYIAIPFAKYWKEDIGRRPNPYGNGVSGNLIVEKFIEWTRL